MKFDHDFHIHSKLSSCSNHPEQTNENILNYAKKNNLKKIILTDHYWDSAVSGASDWYEPQNFEHLNLAKPLPQADGIEFLFGCPSIIHFFLKSASGFYKSFYFYTLPVELFLSSSSCFNCFISTFSS